MMGNKRRFCYFVYIVFLCVMLTMAGCADASLDASKKIVPPNNKEVPLQGKWEVERSLHGAFSSRGEKPEGRWTGKKAEFSAEAAVLGEYRWKNVSYKARRVNAEEYFMYKYRDSVSKLGISSQEIFVVTVSSDDKFLFELVKIDEDEAVMNIDEELLYLRKISETVDEGLNNDENEEVINGIEAEVVPQEDTLLRSGLLLGIRTPVKSESPGGQEAVEEYAYRTLWIAAHNRVMHPILESPDIFFPRKSGFWRLEVKRVHEDGWAEDVVSARSVSDDHPEEHYTSNKSKAFFGSDRVGTLKRVVLYVGNDYISTEVSGRGGYRNTLGEWQENKLQTVPVDGMSGGEGIRISDVAGEDGALAMESAAAGLLDNLNAKGIQETDEANLEENFGLFRKTGHWHIKGRLNYRDGDMVSFLDFKVNLIPPASLVAYDTLHVPWTYIKDRVPQATDAYTSPNRDIAVILAKDQLLVYAISEGRLSGVPLRKVKLGEGDSVVMAEWATGNYVDKWERAYIKNNLAKEVAYLSN